MGLHTLDYYDYYSFFLFILIDCHVSRCYSYTSMVYGFYPHMREMKLNKNNLQKKSEM